MDRFKVAEQLLSPTLTEPEQVALLRQFTLEDLQGPELGRIAQLFRTAMIPVEGIDPCAVDLVGTGGDGTDTFNISTVASFVAAGAGVKIAKHGNRSVSSRSGSFDCLEALKVPIPSTPEQAKAQFDRQGITFLFAPFFHPLMKRFALARKTLAKEGVITLFNILGPLLNPAQVKQAAVGVFSRDLILPVTEALDALKLTKAFVFHGHGMDELSLTGPSHYAHLQNGKITTGTLTPEHFGLTPCTLADLKGGDPTENAAIAEAILTNQRQGAARDMVVLNAAAAIYVSETQLGLTQAIERAQVSLMRGYAHAKLQEMREGRSDDS